VRRQDRRREALSRRFSALANGDELDVENESCIRGDLRRRASRSVGHLWWNRELAAAADAHTEEALVPSLDDLAFAESELERRAAIARAVELRPAEERARVVDGELVAVGGGSSAPDRDVLDLQRAGSGAGAATATRQRVVQLRARRALRELGL